MLVWRYKDDGSGITTYLTQTFINKHPDVSLQIFNGLLSRWSKEQTESHLAVWLHILVNTDNE